MSEYIIEIPDEYFSSYEAERDMYYPDERDNAMRITPIVRCRDCKHYNEKTYEWVNGWTRTYTTCALFDGCRVEPNGFCAWGVKRNI